VTSDSIVIRHFEPSDQEQAREVILSGLQEHWGFRDSSKNPDLANISRNYADATFLVACEGFRIVGTGALKPREDGVAEVLRMSVSADMRRKGIGRMILRRLLEHAGRAGVRRVILETTETWSDVIRFYLARGFEITHREAGDVYFALDLDTDDRLSN
jgi:GNAT superfamily N-acetyltransferase